MIGFKTFRVGEWVVDRSLNQMVHSDRPGEPVKLEPKAMEVLSYLAERAGDVVDKESVIQEVWGGAFVSNEVLTNAIWEIRRALGDDRQTSVFIQTIPKRGYRLVAPVSGPPDRPTSRQTNKAWALGIGGLVLAFVFVVAAILGLWLARPPARDRIVARFSVETREPLASFFLPAVAISPDGSAVVYATARSGLFLRRVDRMESVFIPGTEGGRGPFFSPDGSAIGFFRGNRLATTKLDGASPRIDLTDVGAPRGASWGSDGFIYFTYGSNSGLFRIPENGGDVEPLTELDESRGEWTHRWPEALPEAQAVLFTVARGEIQSFDEASIEALDLRTRKRKVVVERGSFPRIVGKRLLFVRGGEILAAPFDPDSLTAAGSSISVAKDVALYPINGAAQFSVSREGSLVYVPARAEAEIRHRLVWVDRSGNRTPILEDTRLMYDPALSRDGSKIAMSIATAGNSDLWLYDVKRTTLTRLSTSAGEEEHPLFSPEGGRLAYDYSKAGPFRMFARPIDGSEVERELGSGSAGEIPESYAPDGTLVFTKEGSKSGSDLWILGPGAKGEGHPLLTGPFDECYASVSPDGRFLAFSSNESGRLEVYLTTFPEPEARLQISIDGGEQAAWTRNGVEIVYLGKQGLMAVPVQTSPSLSAGTPKKLFDWTPPAATLESSYRNQFDATANGERFVLIDSPDDGAARRWNVVLHWTDEVSRFVH